MVGERMKVLPDWVLLFVCVLVVAFCLGLLVSVEVSASGQVRPPQSVRPSRLCARYCCSVSPSFPLSLTNPFFNFKLAGRQIQVPQVRSFRHGCTATKLLPPTTLLPALSTSRTSPLHSRARRYKGSLRRPHRPICYPLQTEFPA